MTLVIAEMVSFILMVLITSCLYWRCWMYRLYSGKWQENVQLTICSSPSWSASCFFLCFFFSNTQRCWGSDVDLLTKREGVVAPPFIDFCHLIGRRDLPWPYGWEDCSHLWIWPGQCNLAAFLLQCQIILSFRLSPAMPASKHRLRVGWRGGEMLYSISANAGQRDFYPWPFC